LRLPHQRGEKQFRRTKRQRDVSMQKHLQERKACKLTAMHDNKDKGPSGKKENPFGKNTYVGGKKKPTKGKKMSRADFLKMVREKKFAKKKK